MKLWKSLKAVSTLIATILLIGITVVGGIAAYAVFTSAANVGSQKTQVNFEYLALYKSVGEPKAIFAATLKNVGDKPIVSLVVKLHNESGYASPSVTSSTPLEPGKSTSIVLTPPTIHAEYYVVGNFYTVQIVEAKAADGSSFSHATTVMCLGSSSLAESVGASNVYLTVLANPYLGSTTPPPGVYAYSVGQVVNVSATPGVGYKFLWWEYDEEEFIDNPISVFMDKNHTLSAYFISPEMLPGNYSGQPGNYSNLMLEGDYSNWTIYDSFDDLDASNSEYRQFAVVNREETKILIMDVYGFKIKTYDIATKTLTDLDFTSPVINYGIDQYAYWSAYGTYMVVVDAYNQLKIIKNGVVIKTFSYTDLGFTNAQIRTASISPKGKYIAVAGKRSSTGNAGWVILKGIGTDSGATQQAALEGDYSTWTLQWSKTYSSNFGTDWVGRTGFVNEQIHAYEANDVLLIWTAYKARGFLVKLSDGTPKIKSLLTSDYIHGTPYVDVADSSIFHIGDCVILNSATLAGDFAYIVSISGNRLNVDRNFSNYNDYLVSDQSFAVAWLDTNSGGWDTDTSLSLSRYFIYTVKNGYSGTTQFLNIYKDGELKQSINLTALFNRTTFSTLAMTKDGKYILIETSDTPYIFALFKGS